MRNKRRTILTVLSIAFSLFLLATLRSILTELDRGVESASSRRMIVRRATSLADTLPESYRSKIKAVPGVAVVCTFTFFGGIYIEEKNIFGQGAVDPETFFDIYTEAKISEDQKAAFLKDRRSTVVGKKLAEKFGWKLSDRITLKGTFYPVDLELTVRGFFTDPYENNEMTVYFHRLYLDEGLRQKGTVGSYWISVTSPEVVPRVIETIDNMFRNSDAETKTETEKAFQLGFISMLGNINALIAAVSTVVIFTILLVTANTMGMAVRERTREVAVLKTLGFTTRSLFILFLTESLAITLTGGLLGCLGARVLYSQFDLAPYSNGFLGAYWSRLPP